jgi:hypothetical protein
VFAIDVKTALDVGKSALEGMGYEIANVNSDLGLIRTKVRPVLAPAVCDCGTWNAMKVSGSCDSVLVASAERTDDNGTALSIKHECATVFTGRNLYGGITRRETYFCASTGVVEHEFWLTLAKVMSARERKH